jgi:hypothetical protein
MKLTAFLQRRLPWINLPGSLLIALLQRTPMVPLARTAGEFVLASPVSAILKSSAVALASLGALHSLAGATTVTASSATPLSATVGTAITKVAFGSAGTDAQPGSWHVTGTLPPGVAFGGQTNTPISNLNVTNPQLSGTPTTAGTYQLTLVAWEGADETIQATPSFIYTINVGAGVTATAPSITTQPVSQTVNVGANVTFIAAASGSPAPTFQWRKNTANIANATSSSLTLSNVATTDAATYTVVATNSAGSATSNGALLTVNAVGLPPPTITAQPLSVTVNSGGTAALVVTVPTAAVASYQWSKGGVAVAGATSDTLILTATAQTAGSYTVVATNSGGSVTSSAATLAVTSGQVSRISNLSVRTNLASGQLLTVGFVTSASKNLLLRAIGPSLFAVFGLTGFYADPKIAVINNAGVTIAQDDDWNSNLSSVFAGVGAFALTPNSKDAALDLAITGPNTAQINGTGSGVVLVEVYDTDPATASARLTNVSARNLVGTGANILISGFVIDGTAARTVLIRGIGPALNDVFGVTGQLTDPLLEIHQTVNNQDTVIASNDNWNASLTPIFDQVGAYHFNVGSKDAAMLITLPPGVYTAQVSGVNSLTGDGVVEVYEVP